MSLGSEGAAARRGGPAPALMSIGEVLAHLRPEFPDTTISKLRFLEAEGLVEPQRTPAGYRKYSWADVARLRFVLTAQRDQYLPLRVIREQLAALPEDDAASGGFGGSGFGGAADFDDAADFGSRPRPTLVAVGSPADGEADRRLTRDELIARTGIDETTLAEVERLGLVTTRSPGRYDAEAVTITQAVVGLAGYGLEPRHLRAYRASADREVGLFAQLVAPMARQNDPGARARAAETARELVAFSQQLHAALVRVGLRETLGR